MHHLYFTETLLDKARDIQNEEVGFNLMYTTNTAEYLNLPLQFEKPLPTWLQGSLVRHEYSYLMCYTLFFKRNTTFLNPFF